MSLTVPARFGRTREKRATFNSGLFGVGQDNISSPDTFANYGYTSLLGTHTVMSDIVTPGFKERSGRGELLFNPMQQVTNSLASTSTGARLIAVTSDANNGAINYTTGDRLLVLLGGYQATPPDYFTVKPVQLELARKSSAISEACTQAARFPTSASSLVTLAEIRQTARLVPDLLRNWSSLFRDLNRNAVVTRRISEYQSAKRLSASNLRSLERSLTETWLAMRFGVRPLIADTKGVLKVLQKAYDESEAIRLTSRGSAASTATKVESYTITAGVTLNDMVASHQSRYSVRAMQLFEVQLDAWKDAGFGLSSVPEAAIDLVSYSFVVNWVVNVNDFFASLGAYLDPSIVPRGGCYTVLEEHSSTWQAVGMRTTTPIWRVDVPQGGHCYASTIIKTRIPGLESPKLVVRANASQFLRDARLIDAIALLRQQLRGRNVKELLRILR